MLVLSRRRQETLLIGDNVRVQVVEIRPGQVRLGVTAPDEVKVLREEIAQREEKAAGVGPVA